MSGWSTIRSRSAALSGYDLNTVEFAVEDGIPYAIDFMNPAPDAGSTRWGRRISSGLWTRGRNGGGKAPGEPPEPQPEYALGFKGSLAGEASNDAQAVVTPPSLTIGIEEEYQTVDPETRDLRSHIARRSSRRARRCSRSA